MRHRNTTYNNFGEVVSSALAASSSTQSELAAKLNTHPVYVNRLMTGDREPSAKWANLVAHALKLSEEQRIALNRAAAKDNGYALDLSPPKPL